MEYNQIDDAYARHAEIREQSWNNSMENPNEEPFAFIWIVYITIVVATAYVARYIYINFF